MATSTFGKQFSVRADKAGEFALEMSKKVQPTLRKDFHSNSANLAQNKDLRVVLLNPCSEPSLPNSNENLYAV